MADINIEQSIPQINIETDVRSYHLPIASNTTLGGIKVGQNLSIEDDGTLNAVASEYVLPPATSSTLGGVKIGTTLLMNNSVLNVNIDQNLDVNSGNPVRNSVVTSAINEVASDLTELSNSLTSLSNSFDSVSSSVTSQGETLTELGLTVTSLNDSVETNTNDITANTEAISDLTETVTTTSNDLSTLSDTVTNLNNGVNEISSDVGLLKAQVSESITNSYLLPINTWSSGSLQLELRGKIGTLTFDLECTLTMTSSDVDIYTFSEYIPNSDTYGTLLTNAGVINCKVDTDGKVTLINLDGNTKNITKVKGQITLVYQ